ncbi:Hint domain-containing protein [Roseovarius sp. EL26]|uniref:Hint domain-containing protein n=1 Tax=Roseovarius sp. EL26 TaxID=2126672 RepID=UPI000EA0248E|nr:Hint domain-containing protein [Roseovarius sp. EL26]
MVFLVGAQLTVTYSDRPHPEAVSKDRAPLNLKKWQLVSGRLLEQPQEFESVQGADDRCESVFELSGSCTRAGILKTNLMELAFRDKALRFSIFAKAGSLGQSTFRVVINGHEVTPVGHTEKALVQPDLNGHIFEFDFISNGSDEVEIHAIDVLGAKQSVPKRQLLHHSGMVAGTKVQTRRGKVKVENLKPGDLVLTLDSDYQPLIELVEHEGIDRSIIRLAKGSLGKFTPNDDLFLAPKHKVLIHNLVGRSGQKIDEILINAEHLSDAEGISTQTCQPDNLTRYSIRLSTHCILFADGVPIESMSVENMNGHVDRQRKLKQVNSNEIRPVRGYLMARRFMKTKSAQNLIRRNAKNQTRFLDANWLASSNTGQSDGVG